MMMATKPIWKKRYGKLTAFDDLAYLRFCEMRWWCTVYTVSVCECVVHVCLTVWCIPIAFRTLSFGRNIVQKWCMCILVFVHVCNDVAIMTSLQQKVSSKQRRTTNMRETEMYPTVRYNIFLIKLHRTSNISIHTPLTKTTTGKVMKRKEMKNKNDTVVNVLHRIKWPSRPIYVFVRIVVAVCENFICYIFWSDRTNSSLWFELKKRHKIEKQQQLIQCLILIF